MKALFLIDPQDVEKYNKVINSTRHQTRGGYVYGGQKSYTYVKSVLEANQDIKYTEVHQ